MKRLKQGIFLILVSGMVFSFTSCGDDTGTGSDSLNCNSLTLPSQLTPVIVDNSYFNSQSVPNEEQYINYQDVKAIAQTGRALVSSGGVLGIATTFIATAQLLGIQPESGDGNCVWEFDASQFDPDASETIIQVVASSSGDRTLWEVNISGDIGDEIVDNFTFVTGFTSDDGNSGQWTGYDPENPNIEAYVYTWNRDSEEVYQLTLEILDGENSSVTYERDGINSNTMTFFTSNETFLIFWNEENDSGWIEGEGTDRRCYSNFINSPC